MCGHGGWMCAFLLFYNYRPLTTIPFPVALHRTAHTALHLLCVCAITVILHPISTHARTHARTHIKPPARYRIPLRPDQWKTTVTPGFIPYCGWNFVGLVSGTVTGVLSMYVFNLTAVTTSAWHAVKLS